jgi:hypothetical protein
MTPEEQEEASRKALERTPEEWNELRKAASELLAREQNMEPPIPPLQAPSAGNLRSDDKTFNFRASG